MKRNLLKSVAVLAAFFTGVAIHNSCGDPTGGDVRDLWAALGTMQTRITELENQLAELTGGGNSGGGEQGGGSSIGEFMVDGLWFSRGGNTSSKVKRITYTGTADDSTTEYFYDNQGRLQKTVDTSRGRGYTTTTTHQYTGKNHKVTYVMDYDASYPNPNVEDYSYSYTYECY